MLIRYYTKYKYNTSIIIRYVGILGGLQRTLYPVTLCSLLISHNSNLDSRDKCVTRTTVLARC